MNACSGAAFLDVLTTFKQECVFNAFKPSSVLSISADGEISVDPEMFLASEAWRLNKAAKDIKGGSKDSQAEVPAQPTSSATSSEAAAGKNTSAVRDAANKQNPNAATHPSHNPVLRNGSATDETRVNSPVQNSNSNGQAVVDDQGSDGSDTITSQQGLARV